MGRPFRRCHGSRNLELGDVKADRAKQGISIVVFRSKTCCSWVGSGGVKGRPKSKIHKPISQMSLDGLSGLLGHVPEHKS